MTELEALPMPKYTMVTVALSGSRVDIIARTRRALTDARLIGEQLDEFMRDATAARDMEELKRVVMMYCHVETA